MGNRTVNVFFTREMTVRVKFGAASLDDATHQVRQFDEAVTAFLHEYLEAQNDGSGPATNILQLDTAWDKR